jgi:nitrate/TMAO reductase-like tetraheme cytochrome c subunit
MRTLGLVAALVAILGLILIEFVYRKRFARSVYHWLLLIGLAVFPGIALLSTATVFLEETKTVSSCASCHVMQPFVNDMQNPDSHTLAARHYQNRWIPDRQCYVCHTTYGVHGAFNAKLAMVRHWLLYVSRSWQEPIRHRGAYPNKNCLACHEGAQRFTRVSFHSAQAAELTTDQIGCTRCHGAPHPSPNERSATERKP